MKLIAIEAATEACSCALYHDKEVLERHRVAPRRHAELLLADVRDLLDEAGLALTELDGIAFGRGPGSFTGVRIAAALSQGLALAADLPVAPVSTLAALARGAFDGDGPERIVAALDARRNEVYVGYFERGRSGDPVPTAEEAVVAPEQALIPPGDGWLGVGPGFAAEEGALARRLQPVLQGVDREALPRAVDVAAIGAGMLKRGDGLSAERALPVYLREKVADKPGKRKAGGGKRKA